MGGAAALELEHEVAHFVERERLARPHSAVAGKRHRDAVSTVHFGFFKDEVQEAADAFAQVAVAERARRRADEVHSLAKGFDIEAMGTEGVRLALEDGTLGGGEFERDGFEQALDFGPIAPA
jgi:hypothetical protein